MLLLDGGQRAFLEYLRNLTPQILLASTGLVLGSQLDFHRVDLTNWFTTTAFFLCIGLALLAFFANMNVFLDSLLDGLTTYGRVGRRLRLRGVHSRRATVATLRVMVRQRPTLLLDLVATMTIVNVGLVAVAVAAWNAARAVLK